MIGIVIFASLMVSLIVVLNQLQGIYEGDECEVCGRDHETGSCAW